jgi:hypothetical protein
MAMCRGCHSEARPTRSLGALGQAWRGRRETHTSLIKVAPQRCRVKGGKTRDTMDGRLLFSFAIAVAAA